MLLRRSVILALCLALAGVLLGQTIEPHRAYGAKAQAGERLRNLDTGGRYYGTGRSFRAPDRLFVARIG